MADGSGGVQKRTHSHHSLRQTQCNSKPNIFQSLQLVIAGVAQKELARQVKYPKVDNQILRSKLPKCIMSHPELH
ncbi:hypothetical protein ETAA8_40320 [Anatilimnocola aggregata]|uniref:Uncharacterized protein n=1 Tax=Anatilimnocola aggregata TaxID=2528021 RepID=A0A517YFB7_9BACT|nr:hypothetical protein ETAA8_40320 [Anatilimnocola aggregata]